MLADILTMTEHHDGPLEQIAYCFLGDGRNNVARSLLITGALLGMDVRIAVPSHLRPRPRLFRTRPSVWRGSTSSTPTCGSAWARLAEMSMPEAEAEATIAPTVAMTSARLPASATDGIGAALAPLHCGPVGQYEPPPDHLIHDAVDNQPVG